MLRVGRAFLLVGGAIAFAVLVARIGTGVIADMLRRVGWGFLAVSALYATHVAVRAFALWRSLPIAGLPYADVLRVRLSGEAVEVLTFSGPFLAEPAKGWLLTRYGFSTADAYAGVALEYLLNTVISCWMATVALAMLLARGVLPETMHAPAVGNTLCGLQRPSGLNAARSRSIMCRSSGENSLGMKSIFSTPMPCSPVTLPPQWMHSSRIS